MTSIELNNPSAFHSLRIYQQDRARNIFGVLLTEKAATPKRETRTELEKRGSEITTRSHRVMAVENGVLRPVVRDVPEPLWQIEGATSLAEWVTNIQEKIADDIRKGPPADAARGQRVVDSWGEPKPFASVQPGGKARLTLSEDKRYLIECDEEVGLAIANPSNVRTIRLRNYDVKTGETSNMTHIAPAREYPQAGVITAGKTAAGIELMPT